jgi:molecular chaperone GrpE
MTNEPRTRPTHPAASEAAGAGAPPPAPQAGPGGDAAQRTDGVHATTDEAAPEAGVAEPELEAAEAAPAADAKAAPEAAEPEAGEPEAAAAEAAAPAAAEPEAGERQAAAAEPPAAEAPPAEAERRAHEPDYRDRYLRAMAELDNVRKRARRDVSAAEARGIAKLARELLPALDNFDRALAAAEAQPENRDHHLTDGIRLVQAELLGALARIGIEPESPKGATFDPHLHEAVAQQPIEGTASGTIVEVYQQGYRYGDDLLRPAKVVVAA